MDDRDGPALLLQLRQLWAELLQLPLAEVGCDSHFLLLGGDSLQLLRLLAVVQQRFGCSLPAHELARFATPARMLDCCLAAASPAVAEAAAPCSAEGLVRVPATALQQGLWLAEQFAAPQQLYLASVLLHLEGPLQLWALQQAFVLLQQQHPLLRARLLHEAQTRRLYLLFVAPATATPLPLLLQDCSEHDWRACAQAAAQLPLPLEQGPLCRLLLLRRGEQRHVLLLSCHHIISDGWSGGILLQQLAQHYAALLGGTAVFPPRVDQHFAAYCLRQSVAESDTEEALAAWRSRLRDVDERQRWLWRERPAVAWPYRLTARRVSVPLQLVQHLRFTARQQCCSLFCCFLEATCTALQELSGERCQPLLLPMARRRPEEEQSIGCFIETLLLVADWAPGLPLAAALHAASVAFDSARRELLPLATLAAGLRPRLLPDGNPWSSILFAFQSYPQATAQWPGLRQQLERLPATFGQHALKLEVLPTANDWQLYIEYATELLEPEWIETWIQHWLERLGQLATLGGS